MVFRFGGLLTVVWAVALVGAASLQRGESTWPSYGGSQASLKYSPLDQIDRSNAGRMKIAWRWRSIDEDKKQPAGVRPWLFEATPLMIGSTLYVSTGLGQVAAIDAASGRTIWTQDPVSYRNRQVPIYGFTHRGVAYWPGALGVAPRILMGTVDGYLLAIDAGTGEPSIGFGREGRVDLLEEWSQVARSRYTVTSPPIVVGNVVVVGSGLNDTIGAARSQPPGDVRGFDARTGRRLWTFHSVPRDGEAGHDTWLDNSSRTPRGVSAWTLFSADEALGYVYVPFSAPSGDYYGGDRPGDNLFGSSLVCLDAATGRRIWHFQTTRHDVWDYDPPAAPILADINVDGRRVRAVAQVSKSGFVFVLDRVTGAPVWPVVERAVPQAGVQGERPAKTQPFPTKPVPFDRQGASEADLIDFTPALRTQALEIFRRYDGGSLYTLPSLRGTISVPGSQGGASWAGAAFDPETQILYVPSVTRPTVMTIYPKDDPRFAGRETTDRYFGYRALLLGPEGLPLFKPPFGRITAIDLGSGGHRWMVPSGDGPRDHPALRDLKLPRLGWPLRTFVLATKTLLFAVQEGPVGPERTVDGHLEADHVVRDASLRAYDKQTGADVARVDLPANATGSPMTYMIGGRQFIVVAVGGSNLPAELVALALE